MQSKVSTPIAVIVIAVVVAIAGFFLWRSQQATKAPVDDKGIPLAPPAGQAGAKMMQDFYKSGKMPAASPSQGAPLTPAAPGQ